jgi:RHS repeat-associated protein
VGSVLQLATTVPTTGGGTQTDSQSFCYDAVSRLVWAGNSGTPSGGDHCGTAPSGTTLSPYQQSFSYDGLDRLTGGPAGSLTYGDSNHVHAATTLGNFPNPYASYDAMGNMICRNTDTTSGHTCGSSPTGALMSYDNEGRLASWTAPTGTTASDGFLYDNEGNRVLQRVNNGSVTDTITFDGYTETVLTGGTTTTTKYYNVNGQRVALKTGSTLSYLLSDLLGSSTIALTSSGSTQAVQLFAPYGSIRYSQGSMPTTYNFTGQRLDSQTGLLYYTFRYYDPVSGRFVRADTTQTNAGGMDPYAYVGNNPEGRTDPTGHCWPWCTALIGAAVGAVVGVAVTTVTSYATTGKPPSGGELVQAAVSGAVSGAIVVVLGPGAGVVSAIGIGALSGSVGGVAGRLAYNGVTRHSWSDGPVQAGVEGAVIGGLTGGVLKAASPLLGRVGRAVADDNPLNALDKGGPNYFRTLITDAYRGAKSVDALFNLTRQDLVPGTRNVATGLSHWAEPDFVQTNLRAPYWKLPAGTDAPTGTIWNYTWQNIGENWGWHIGLEPELGTSMTTKVYLPLVRGALHYLGPYDSF